MVLAECGGTAGSFAEDEDAEVDGPGAASPVVELGELAGCRITEAVATWVVRVGLGV